MKPIFFWAPVSVFKGFVATGEGKLFSGCLTPCHRAVFNGKSPHFSHGNLSLGLMPSRLYTFYIEPIDKNPWKVEEFVDGAWGPVVENRVFLLSGKAMLCLEITTFV